MTIMTDYGVFYGIYDNPGERFFLMNDLMNFRNPTTSMAVVVALTTKPKFKGS